MIRKGKVTKCFNSVKRQTCTKLTDLHTVRWYSVTSIAAIEYKEIDWKKCISDLRAKQAEIVRAYRNKSENKKVSRLQKELVRSFAARALAVRKVSTNSGKKTPGIDQVIWDTDEKKIDAIKRLSNLANYKALPVKRIYIPKADGTPRPLGIPTMRDRAVQTMWTFALDPIAEEMSDTRSYGFRPYRGVHDCATYLHLLLSSKHNLRRHVLDADIKNFFNSVSHNWLMDNIPMDKKILNQFIKAGFLKTNQFNSTDVGFPQGGCISPLIARMVLDGLEDELGEEYRITRYADDFIVLGKSKNRLKKHALPIVQKFLNIRGLELNLDKTNVRTVQQGFDFLGLHFKEYEDPKRAKGTKKGIFLVTPSKQKITDYKKKLSKIVKASRSAPIAVLINTLNLSLRGWAEHYRAVTSTKTFNDISRHVFIIIYKFLKHRYKGVPKRQIVQRHFTKIGNNRWVFCGKPLDGSNLAKKSEKALLFQIGYVKMKRHMVCKPLNMYDPANYEYFEKRIARTNVPDLNPKSLRSRLFKKQKGVCLICQGALNQENDLEIHHKLAKSKGGKDTLQNLVLLHKECHKQVTHTKNEKLIASFKVLDIIR